MNFHPAKASPVQSSQAQISQLPLILCLYERGSFLTIVSFFLFFFESRLHPSSEPPSRNRNSLPQQSFSNNCATAIFVKPSGRPDKLSNTTFRGAPRVLLLSHTSP